MRAPDEVQRLRALAGQEILDTAPEPAYDDIVTLAAAICGTPISLVSFVDSERQWFKARHGIEVSETPRDVSFCAHAILGEDVFEVEDATLDARFATNALVTSAPHIRFYAGAPLLSPDGHGLGTVCVIDTVPRKLTSEQREALAALGRQATTLLELARLAGAEQAAKERHRVLTEQLPGAAYVEPLNASSAMYISPQIERLTGYSPDEWTADPAFFGVVLHPDDRERVLAAFTRAREELESVSAEYRIVHRDGRTVWIHDEAAIAYDDNGEPLYVQGYMTEIDERKAIEGRLIQARERYRALAEQLPLVTYVDDTAEQRVIYISPQIEQLVGVSAEEWLAHPGAYASVLHPDDRDDVLARTRSCRQAGFPFEYEYRMVTRRGDVIWVRDAAVPMGDPSNPHQWQGYVIDITERKHAEEQREQLLEGERSQNERLLELDRMKDVFVASVSHELRTPLTSIRGYLELVLDGEAGPLSGEQEEFLGIVNRNSDRLLALVGDLLDVAQVEAGTLSLACRPSDVGTLVADSIASAAAVAADRGLTLTFAVEEVPAIDLDCARLSQVLDNLLSNALKFTPRGGSVDVRVRSSGTQVVVEVADTGMGMSPFEQERLFERFYRTASASTQAIPGTGLGLWISKAIVEAHGGEIGVESSPGRGTTFRIGLPLSNSLPHATERAA